MLSGAGFTPNAALDICWTSVYGTCANVLTSAVYSLRTDPYGRFSVDLVVPNDTPGAARIDVRDAGGREQSTTFALAGGTAGTSTGNGASAGRSMPNW